MKMTKQEKLIKNTQTKCIWIQVHSSDNVYDIVISKRVALGLVKNSPDGFTLCIEDNNDVSFEPRGYISSDPIRVD